MRRRTNKWIFNSVFGLVVSLPFLIPGCSPLGGSSKSDPGAAAVVDQVVALANVEAQASGEAADLDQVVAFGNGDGGSAMTGLPGAGDAGKLLGVLSALGGGSAGEYAFVREGDRVLVRKAGSDAVVCTVTVNDSGAAVADC